MEICSKLRMFLSWLTAVAILHMNHRAQSDQVSRFLHRALNNQNCPGFAVLMVWDEPVGVSDTEREHTDAWDSWCSESHKNPKTRIMLCHAVLGTLEQMFRGEQGEAHNRWFYITRCCNGWAGAGRRCPPAGLLSLSPAQAPLGVRRAFSRSCCGISGSTEAAQTPSEAFHPLGTAGLAPTSHPLHSSWMGCLKISAFTHFSQLCKVLICCHTAPGIFHTLSLRF